VEKEEKIGCHYGGGDGFFSRVKRLNPKCMEYRNGYLRVLAVGVEGLKRCNFLPRHIVTKQPVMHR